MVRRSMRRLAIATGATLSVSALVTAGAVPAMAAGHGTGRAHGGHGNSGSRHVVTAQPSWTTAARKTADLAAGQPVAAKVWLALRDAAGLDSLARAVSDPASPNYHHFLTADQYGARFAPTGDTVAQVTSWLRQAGLTVTGVGPDNHFVSVTGTAGAAEQAFGTNLARFSVNGETVQAPSTSVSVPSAVAGSVLAVTGLNTLNHKVTPAFGAPAAYVNGTPCSDYYGQKLAKTLPRFGHDTLPYAVCGYTPNQLRAAYGETHTGLTGRGQTVAIVDAYSAPTILSDANTYATRHGDAAFRSGQFIDRSAAENTSTGAACGGNGWYGEETLDVEAVHGIARDANVAYYGAASCYDDDLLASLARVVQDDTASIVSNSWGEPTFVVINGTLYITIDQTWIDAYESVFEQGAVQGIGFYFSSGDSGDEQAAWGYKHPDWPTGDPWVTSVGGTSLAAGRSGTRQFETGWGTDKYVLSKSGASWVPAAANPFLYGAGGGFSQIFARPGYQQGVVPANTTGRAVPDIAMDADPTTGMLVGETQAFAGPSRFGPAGVHYGEYRIGGTSLASPLLAGVQAVVQQGAGRLGFANPLIYGLARHDNGQGFFYDVRPERRDAGNIRADFVNGLNASGGMVYSVRTFDDDSSLATTKGWDDVSGVGSVTDRYIRAVAGR